MYLATVQSWDSLCNSLEKQLVVNLQTLGHDESLHACCPFAVIVIVVGVVSRWLSGDCERVARGRIDGGIAFRSWSSMRRRPCRRGGRESMAARGMAKMLHVCGRLHLIVFVGFAGTSRFCRSPLLVCTFGEFGCKLMDVFCHSLTLSVPRLHHCCCHATCIIIGSFRDCQLYVRSASPMLPCPPECANL